MSEKTPTNPRGAGRKKIGETGKSINIYLTADLHKAAVKYCVENDIQLSRLVRETIDFYLKSMIKVD